jgi:hypothetical protein
MDNEKIWAPFLKGAVAGRGNNQTWIGGRGFSVGHFQMGWVLFWQSVRTCVVAVAHAKDGGSRHYSSSKNDKPLPYRRANSFSSMISTRRSPDSHLDTYDCARPRACAACTCVRPAFSRASLRRPRNDLYSWVYLLLFRGFPRVAPLSYPVVY